MKVPFLIQQQIMEIKRELKDLMDGIEWLRANGFEDFEELDIYLKSKEDNMAS